MTTNPFHIRLNSYIINHYKTRKKFCDATGFNINTLQQMFSNRATNPSLSFFEAFLTCHSPNDMGWIIRGDAPHPMKDNDPVVVLQPNKSISKEIGFAIEHLIDHKLQKQYGLEEK